jgi:hypothetical protein
LIATGVETKGLQRTAKQSERKQNKKVSGWLPTILGAQLNYW